MIGKAFAPGWGFKGLALYLERGDPGAEVPPHRVEWMGTCNLPTRHPHAAARIMAATARDSDSVQPPLYHMVISFDPGDPVDRDTMRRVAERTMRDLGLQEHQAVIVAHRDRAHRHLHFMINRVHPERLKVWNNWFDYGRIERSLRRQEEELGLRVVPGKHAPVPASSRSRAPAPRRIRGNAEFLARVQAQAGPHLLGARSWAEVESGLGEHGLSVQIKNGGMVVTDGVFEVKASEVDRAVSRNHLERRLGALGAYRARQAVAARTLEERAAAHPQPPAPAVAPAPEPAAPTPAAQVPHAPMTPAPARPVEPPTPARRPEVAATPPAPAEAAPGPPRLAPPARDAQRKAPRPEPVDPRVARAAELLEMGEAVHEAGESLRRAQVEAEDAERLAAVLKGRAKAAPPAVAQYWEELGKVYADPKASHERIKEARKRHGLADTLRVVRESPDRFGALLPDKHTGILAPLRRRTYGSARRNAPYLAVVMDHAVGCAQRKPTPEALARAETDARTARAAADRAHAHRDSLSGRSYKSLRQDAARTLQPLLASMEPNEIARQLAARLGPGSLALALETVRVARGPDPDTYSVGGL